MDQHPIPQNVTGFQFKLIGSMTVKQFGYVAFGVILAVIIYYLPLTGVFFVLLKSILIPVFGSIGVIIAFIPIDGRPIDLMFGNFIQALFSPNQYVYRKEIKSFSFSNIAQANTHLVLKNNKNTNNSSKQILINEKGLGLQKILTTIGTTKIKNDIDAREAAYLSTLSASPSLLIASPLPQNVPPVIPVVPATPAPPPTAINNNNIDQPEILISTNNISDNPNTNELSNKESLLKKQLEEAKREEVIPHNPQDLTKIHQKVTDLEKQIQEIYSEKKALEQEIISLKTQLINPQQNQSLPAKHTQVLRPATVQKPQTPHVRSITKELNKNIGLIVSDTPNVITGIVKDSRGNVLQNILVEIKDQNGNPVRAFKTNSLGNFASATPLSPGAYAITLEDLKKVHTFDTIQFTINNQIMAPIEITSYDKREELRKELFS